jgi:hypothetical protein
MKFRDIPWYLGNCVNTDVETWFIGDSHKRYKVQKRICGRCSIKEQCNTWANENHEVGYWGGQYFTYRTQWDGDGIDTVEVHGADNGDQVPEVRSDAASTVPTV